MRVSSFHDVFHHEADPGKVKELRDAVVDDIHRMLRKPGNFAKIGASDLSPDELTRMREKYRRLLHYGAFNLPSKRAVANELIWKWTEASGKYLGCQFWSLKAKNLFDLEAAKCDGQTTLRSLEKRLSSKSRPKSARLTHEHVYPIKDIKRWLRDHKESDHHEIRNYLEHNCVGCVLLESEHDRKAGDDANPWLRYSRADITLSLNPAWPDVQRARIQEAGLIGRH